MKKILELSRNQLLDRFKDKPIEEITIYDFKVGGDLIESFGLVVFVDWNLQEKTLKNRYKK